MGDNISDPLTLYYLNSLELVLVFKPLEGHNYGQWSRPMCIALSARNKLGFIDGTIKPLPISQAVCITASTHLWCGMILRTGSHKAMTLEFSKSTKKLPNINKNTL
jgi:hypothetical protein